jgi:hypothetical protein
MIDKMLYIILLGYWCDVIVLNVHASAEDESDDKMANPY